MTDSLEKPKSEAENIVNFIKAIAAIEYDLELLREHKKDLKEQYKKNDWLDSDKQKVAIRAYKMIKKQEDPKQLADFYNTISEKVGLIESFIVKAKEEK